ncbi:hypothetical protein [Spongorhabdus nitratireducens]
MESKLVYKPGDTFSSYELMLQDPVGSFSAAGSAWLCHCRADSQLHGCSVEISRGMAGDKEFCRDKTQESFREQNLFYIETSLLCAGGKTASGLLKPASLVLMLDCFEGNTPRNAVDGSLQFLKLDHHNQRIQMTVNLTSKSWFCIQMPKEFFKFSFCPQDSYLRVRDAQYKLVVPEPGPEKTCAGDVAVDSGAEHTRKGDALFLAFYESPTKKSDAWLSTCWLIDAQLIDQASGQYHKDMLELEATVGDSDFFCAFETLLKIEAGEIQSTDIDAFLDMAVRRLLQHNFEKASLISSHRLMCGDIYSQILKAYAEVLKYFLNRFTGYNPQFIQINIDDCPLEPDRFSGYPLAKVVDVYRAMNPLFNRKVHNQKPDVVNLHFLAGRTIVLLLSLKPDAECWPLLSEFMDIHLRWNSCDDSDAVSDIVLSEFLCYAEYHKEQNISLLLNVCEKLQSAINRLLSSKRPSQLKVMPDRYRSGLEYIWSLVEKEQHLWIEQKSVADGSSARNLTHLDSFLKQIEFFGIVPVRKTKRWKSKLAEWHGKGKALLAKEKQLQAREMDVKRKQAAKTGKELLEAVKLEKKAEELRLKRDQRKTRKKGTRKGGGAGKAVTKKVVKVENSPVVTEEELLTEWEKSYQAGVVLYVRKQYPQAMTHYQKMYESHESELEAARLSSAISSCILAPCSTDIVELEKLTERAERYHSQFKKAVDNKERIPQKAGTLNRTVRSLTRLSDILLSPVLDAALQKNQAIDHLRSFMSQSSDDIELDDAGVLLALIEIEYQRMNQVMTNVRDALRYLIDVYEFRYCLLRDRGLLNVTGESTEARLRHEMEAVADSLDKSSGRQSASASDTTVVPGGASARREVYSPDAATGQKAPVADMTVELRDKDDRFRKKISDNLAGMTRGVVGLGLNLRRSEELKRLAPHKPVLDE